MIVIVKIENGLVVVEANGKLAGRYTWDDFTDDELLQEKYTLVSRLLCTETGTREKREEVEALHSLIAKINGELDVRKVLRRGLGSCDCKRYTA